MIDAVVAGALTIEKLEAMTCVCSVGLDMIAIPGSTSAATISGMIADESAIGMVNQKNDGSEKYSGSRKGSGRYGRVWWIAGLCTGNAGQTVSAVKLL